MSTILIVEDDRAALTTLEDQRFDVMLLDIWMPKINGLELLGRLREKPGQPKIWRARRRTSCSSTRRETKSLS